MRSRPWVLFLTTILAYLTVPHRARAQDSERLFDSKNLLQLRIATDLGALMKERDSL